MSEKDSVIIARYIPTGQETTMLYSTFNGLKNKTSWQFIGYKYPPTTEAAPATTEATTTTTATKKAAKKKGCNCGK